MKALIINGGRGRRLKEITNGNLPKGHIIFYGKPLIAYQLELLEKLGIHDVVIAYTSQDQVRDFEVFMREKLLPRLNYTVDVRVPQESDGGVTTPVLAFKSRRLRQSLLGEDFIKVHSDLIFTLKDMEGLMALHRSNGNTTMSTYIAPARSTHELASYEEERELAWVKRMSGNFRCKVSGVTVVSKYDMELIFEIIDLMGYDIINYALEGLISVGLKKDRSFNVFNFSSYINMNTYNDYLVAKDYLSKRKKL